MEPHDTPSDEWKKMNSVAGNDQLSKSHEREGSEGERHGRVLWFCQIS